MWHNSVPRRPTDGGRVWSWALCPDSQVQRIECNPQIRDWPRVFAHPPRRAADQRGSGMAATLQPLTQQLELAHVLVLDIAGSSSLPVAQQGALLENLQEFVHCTREFGRAQAKDQITEVPSGDGMALVFFGDPEAPLRCAVEISRSARSTNNLSNTSVPRMPMALMRPSFFRRESSSIFPR